MRRAAIGFVFGAWLLQQQAILPAPYWAFFLIPSVYFALAPHSFRPLKSVNVVFLASLLGFFWAAGFASIRLSDELSAQWQQKNIELIGVIASLPEVNERGERFGFDIEKVLAATPVSVAGKSTNAKLTSATLANQLPAYKANVALHVPRHISLNFYREFNRIEQAANNKITSANDKSTSHQPNLVSQFHAGERWQLNVRLKRPHTTYNPHGFDFEAWAMSENVRATGTIYQKSGFKKLSNFVWRPAYMIEAVREKIGNHISQTLVKKPYAGVIRALVIGDDSEINQANWNVYLRTGTNHLMSISGLHITMLASLTFAVVAFVWRRNPSLVLRMPTRNVATFAGLGIAILYALLAGMSIPTQRTLLMLITFALALLTGRNMAISRALAIALIVVVLIDPWAVIAPGFWLSFSAVAIIAYCSVGRLQAQYWLKEAINTQWAITIGLLPLLMVMFGQTSLVSPIANALAIPIISLIVVPLSILGSLLPVDFMLLTSNWVLEVSMVGLNWLASLPLAVWQQAAPPFWVSVLAMLGVLWLLLPKGFPQRWLGLILLTPLFLIQPPHLRQGEMQASILDVGQGLSVVIKTATHTFLYDAGSRFSAQNDAGNRIVVPYLRGEGIKKLDGFMVSHDDTDHSGGAASVMAQIPVQWLSTSFNTAKLIPDENTQDLFKQYPQFLINPVKPVVKPLQCFAGQHWQWDKVKFEVLYPSLKSYQDSTLSDNNKSCVVKVTSQYGSILLTGDIEKQAENLLLQASHQAQLIDHSSSNVDSTPFSLKSDVLTAPHHGSKTSSTLAFIQAVDAKYAVFSVGYLNRFKHPKELIERRYEQNWLHYPDSKNYRSDYHGALIFSFTQTKPLQVQAWRQTHPKYWHN